ncbi:hypothetical protein [Micromonospora sp. NPDC049497]|uniref:hypothetical protein n=1 Tax=Micromonospora sp. NPDC049497 TaxID=3364273 RepID=UPI0037A91C15
MMTRTTPARPLDLSELFSGVNAFARTATRLHPRPGDPDVGGSHVGGRLLWPADEPWPVCAGPHVVRQETAIAPDLVARMQAGDRAAMQQLARDVPGFAGTMTTDQGSVAIGSVTVSEPTPSPMVAVAQLHAADVADLRCPDDADLLQVLWCPNQHRDGDYAGPAVQLRWRTASGVTTMLPTPPPPTVAREEDYLPRPCALHPEQVVEYPWWQELPAELGQRIRQWDDSRQFGEETYFSVSQAPGWKVGGYANWEVSDVRPMDCPNCRQRIDLLLTISSSESDGGSWMPVEESHLQPSWTDPQWRAVNEPTGITVGRRGDLRIFACFKCPATPYRLNLQ